MSKIGKKPIIIPDNVEFKINGGFLELKGAGGVISLKILPHIKVKSEDKTVSFVPENDSKQARANWGTIRALTFNAVVGVAQGFNKILEIEGVGFKANMEGDILVLNIGYSHPVKFVSPEGIKISVEKNTIKVSGIDKALVGETAAKIRALKKPEPYKGKGIKYQGEVIRRKAGKKVAGAAK
ncbi:MAG: 50S ribosomal protein L6 [Patescibacteria group bacterium]